MATRLSRNAPVYAQGTPAMARRTGRDLMEDAVTDLGADALRVLQDRAAIADLVHTYALHIRSGNAAACADLFAADAIYEMHGLDGESGSARLKNRPEGIYATMLLHWPRGGVSA